MENESALTPGAAERLAARERPEGSPVMYQSWADLLFMHWRVPVEALRRLIPPRLEIDTFEGEAWVGVTPFTLSGVRPVFTPPLPFVSEFDEINVRTYVHLDGVPGVWFFSLDANSTVAVAGARMLFRLPYFPADIKREQSDDTTVYMSAREGDPAAYFGATWVVGEERGGAEPGTLDFFLVERYCLYTADAAGAVYRARIHHRPWPLRKVRVETYRSSMVEAAGLGRPEGAPLLHHGGPVDVEVWPLEKV
ncbi:MAG TPA: DUF2071 domain-containing protein [Pyrinomonadaceae bacterium]|nr:DUF2071 domain-containing protein [Pyrinomonadaceae bacterium]